MSRLRTFDGIFPCDHVGIKTFPHIALSRRARTCESSSWLQMFPFRIWDTRYSRIRFGRSACILLKVDWPRGIAMREAGSMLGSFLSAEDYWG